MVRNGMFLAIALTGIAIVASLTIPMSLLIPQIFASEQQEAVMHQHNNNPSTNMIVPITTSQPLIHTSSDKTFYVFATKIEGLDESTAGITADIFTPPIIVVNSGDNVTINFYTTETMTEERHSFTIDTPPYSLDIDIARGETGNATFTTTIADKVEVFTYYCKYHVPTMFGQLVVLPTITQPEQEQQELEQQLGTTTIGEEEQLSTTEGEEGAEQQQPLTITTDRESYSTGDTIVIFGSVAERQPGSRASITVIDPQNEIVWRESVMIATDNTYQLEIQAGQSQYGISPHAIDASGTYLVTASYRAERAETTFQFTSEE
jgi:plastocyanin